MKKSLPPVVKHVRGWAQEKNTFVARRLLYCVALGLDLPVSHRTVTRIIWTNLVACRENILCLTASRYQVSRRDDTPKRSQSFLTNQVPVSFIFAQDEADHLKNALCPVTS